MEKYMLIGCDPETDNEEVIDTTYSRVEAERWLTESRAEAKNDPDVWPVYFLHVEEEPEEEAAPACEPGEEYPPHMSTLDWDMHLAGMRQSDFV